jgi:hypothetical protein
LGAECRRDTHKGISALNALAIDRTAVIRGSRAIHRAPKKGRAVADRAVSWLRVVSAAMPL